MSNKQWYRVDFMNNEHRISSTEYAFSDFDELCQQLLTRNSPFYEIHEAKPEEVPVIQRGLAEATTEALRDELAKRGWKVTA